MSTIWAAICKMSSIDDVTRPLRHLLAGTRNMPSQKGKRAKGVQMTEQQPKTPQIIDIVEMQPTADIVQSTVLFL
jgi:hypothetical protein